MKIELIPEPKIEFADNFICDDPKLGINVAGFYSKTNHTHRSEIHYAVIGTNQNIQDLNDWIKRIAQPIEATISESPLVEDSEIKDGEVLSLFDKKEFNSLKIPSESFSINKKLNPDFPGFNKNSKFNCEFHNDDSNNISIKSIDIDCIMNSKTKKLEKIESIISLYTEAYSKLVDTGGFSPLVQSQECKSN